MIPPLARRFLAGEHPDEAIDHARALDDHNVGAILNLLGEHYDDRAAAAADARTYCRLASDIAAADLDACVSVKPTQLGLAIGEECFRDNLETVVRHAAERDVFVWLDMEGHGTTAATLDAFVRHACEHHTVGVCIQANLKRTGADLERLADLPGKVRLVKGAYNPPAAVAYTDRDRIEAKMRDHLEFMFREFDDGVALGSHDPDMIAHAADLHETHGTPYEIQMLLGVRTQAQYDLAAHHDVYQYAPFGTRWPAYFYRRMTERWENVAFALRALLPG